MAKAFFYKALRTHGCAPMSITLDCYAASHRAVREMPSENEVWKHTKLRTSKYLNNLIEQDHRGIKSSRIHKGQFAIGLLRVKDQAVPAIWNAVLSA